jgi:hypothetical protein
MATNPETKNAGIVITFNPPVVVKSIGGINITTNQITIVKEVDNPVEKTVKVYTDKGIVYTLWSGQTYDSIGQWTDVEVIERLRQILTTGH